MRENDWTLSDCLNEIAFCRQDIPSCLQPRPRAQHASHSRVASDAPADVPPPPAATRKRKRTKGSGKGADTFANAKAKAKSASVRPAAQDFDKSWFKQVNGEEVCMRAALGRKFAHVCPAPFASGKPCGQKHSAAEHQKTKH